MEDYHDWEVEIKTLDGEEHTEKVYVKDELLTDSQRKALFKQIQKDWEFFAKLQGEGTNHKERFQLDFNGDWLTAKNGKYGLMFEE